MVEQQALESCEIYHQAHNQLFTNDLVAGDPLAQNDWGGELASARSITRSSLGWDVPPWQGKH